MKKLIGRPLLLVIGVVVVGAIVGIVATQIVLKPAAEQSAIQAIKNTPTPTPEPPLGPTYEIKQRIANLADPGGRRYLRATIVIEFSTHKPIDKLGADAQATEIKAEAADIATKAPIIDDTITTVLTSKTYNDIASPEGKEQLKQDVADAIDNALPSWKVAHVFFTDFVVQ